MMKRCQDCEWVETTSLGSLNPTYTRSRYCTHHQGIAEIEHHLRERAALKVAIPPRDPRFPWPMLQPENGILIGADGQPIIWYPDGFDSTRLWRADWPMARTDQPLWVNLMHTLSWVIAAALVVLPALLVACVARLAMPRRS